LCATSGVEALKVWDKENGAIDLLMTDMVMPEGVSGLELAERLLARKPDLRVLYTSGYSMQSVDLATKLRPGIGFLPKPYPVDQLAEAIRQCLDATFVTT
jgi:two-component system, cell cycle sensor histidine kinase and response regulator CckA